MTLRWSVSAVVLGDRRDKHFRAATAWLAANIACRFYVDAAAALAASTAKTTTKTSDDHEPSLLVLLQSRPGAFTDAELTALRSRWPLARVVSIAASWCEGEPRSGQAAAGLYRIPWQAAVERLTTEFGRQPNGRAGGATHGGLAIHANRGLFDLPATATVDERLLANARPHANVPGVVAVAARRKSWAEPLVEALAAAGHAAVYWPLDRSALARGIDAVVWDTDGCDQALDAYRQALPAGSDETPIVAVADFPRPQDAVRLTELGVLRVLAKPLLFADVLTCLDALRSPSTVAQPSSAAVA